MGTGILALYPYLICLMLGAMIKTTVQAVTANLFADCAAEERFALLKSAVLKSVEKAKKHESMKTGLIKTTEIVTSLDKIVGSMLGPYPPAAMAWSGICAILPVRVFFLILGGAKQSAIGPAFSRSFALPPYHKHNLPYLSNGSSLITPSCTCGTGSSLIRNTLDPHSPFCCRYGDA